MIITMERRDDMVVLWILGILLAVIALIIIIVLLLPVDVLFFTDEQGEFKILYKFLGKLYGEEPDPNNPLIRSIKALLGLSHLDSIKKVQSTIEKRGTAATIKDTLSILVALIDRVVWILKYCTLTKCHITSIGGGEDAAIDYGTARATVYPIAEYVKNSMKHTRGAFKIDLRCDYSLEETHNAFDVAVRVKIFHAVKALFHVARRKLENKGMR